MAYQFKTNYYNGRINTMKSLEELKAIREKMKNQIGLRNETSNQTRIVVGMATCGIASGARPVLTAFSNLVQEKKLENTVVTQTGCIGLCQYEPIVEIYEPGKDKVTYIEMTAEKAKEVVEKHLIGKLVVSKYTINEGGK